MTGSLDANNFCACVMSGDSLLMVGGWVGGMDAIDFGTVASSENPAQMPFGIQCLLGHSVI